MAKPTVSVVLPSSVNPTPILLLKSENHQEALTGAEAVHLAGDLLEGAGRLVNYLDERQQMQIVQDLGKIFEIFSRGFTSFGDNN